MLTELVRTDGPRAGANLKGCVVKAGARYRAEQGSDYDPAHAGSASSDRIGKGQLRQCSPLHLGHRGPPTKLAREAFDQAQPKGAFSRWSHAPAVVAN